MFLQEFYSVQNGQLLINAQQASQFAKDIAGDFNPLHDIDAKRFCVPGDLLFSLVLEKYGLSQKMAFTFSGMVGEDVLLNFPVTDAASFEITDDKGKTYLKIERSGPIIRDNALIEAFIREYVAFSGHNFPDVLVPLMAKSDVMINTERPLVIYDSMSFELNQLDLASSKLQASDTDLNVNGKRGDANLHFDIKVDDNIVGKGVKKLLISGIKTYEQDVIEKFVNAYLARIKLYRQETELVD